jgi:hypothetical protein
MRFIIFVSTNITMPNVTSGSVAEVVALVAEVALSF